MKTSLSHKLLVLNVLFLIGLFVVLFFACDTRIGRWKSIGKNINDTDWSFDTKSIAHPDKNIVRVWVRLTPVEGGKDFLEIKQWLKKRKEEHPGRFEVDPESYRYKETLYEIDCSRNGIAEFTTVYYTKDREEIYESTVYYGDYVGAIYEYEFIRPGTMWDVLRNAFCK